MNKHKKGGNPPEFVPTATTEQIRLYMCTLFLNLVSNNKGELKAKLISSKKLSENEQKKIQTDLSKNFKSSLNLDYIYDPDLIAGLIIQIGSVMIDTSVKTKLKKLEKNMLEA